MQARRIRCGGLRLSCRRQPLKRAGLLIKRGVKLLAPVGFASSDYRPPWLQQKERRTYQLQKVRVNGKLTDVVNHECSWSVGRWPRFDFCQSTNENQNIHQIVHAYKKPFLFHCESVWSLNTSARPKMARTNGRIASASLSVILLPELVSDCYSIQRKASK